MKNLLIECAISKSSSAILPKIIGTKEVLNSDKKKEFFSLFHASMNCIGALSFIFEINLNYN